MKLIKNYENFNDSNSDTIIELSEKLKKECKLFINDMKVYDSFLYRGLINYTDVYIKNKVRKNRIPKSTDIEIHTLIDDLFFEKFNIRPRSESVFVTSSYCNAFNYGNVFLFFPVGDYISISSDKVDDLYAYINEVYDISNLHELTEDKYNYIKDELKDLVNTYKINDMSEVIKSGNEIMIICDEYYIIRQKYESQLRKLLILI